MIRTHDQPAFLGRFGTARSQIRRAEISCGLWWTLVAAAGGVAVLAAADFWWELPWPIRAAGLALVACLALAVAALGIAGPIRWWSRPRTAMEIERRFPQLGQRVRTVVQYSGRSEQSVADEGALPTLVAALEDDTDTQTGPLDLGVLVPRRKILVSGAAAIAVVVLLAAAVVLDPQWRLAVRRALLDNAPYTTLSVSPGDVLVDQGGDVRIALAVEGRVPQNLFVYSRPADRPEEKTKLRSGRRYSIRSRNSSASPTSRPSSSGSLRSRRSSRQRREWRRHAGPPTGPRPARLPIGWSCSPSDWRSCIGWSWPRGSKP